MHSAVWDLNLFVFTWNFCTFREAHMFENLTVDGHLMFDFVLEVPGVPDAETVAKYYSVSLSV